MRRRTARGWRTTRWTIDRSGSRTGAKCWTEPARTRERAPVSAATEYDAAFRNDAGGYFLPADASSPAFGRKRSRAVSKIIRCVRNFRARLSKSMASIFVTSSLPSTIGARFAIFMVYFNRAAFWHRTGSPRRKPRRPHRAARRALQSRRGNGSAGRPCRPRSARRDLRRCRRASAVGPGAPGFLPRSPRPRRRLGASAIKCWRPAPNRRAW